MNLPLEVLAALSLAGQQVTENLLGPYLKGHWARIGALGVTIGLAFAARELDIDGLKDLSSVRVLVLGLFAGLGANVTHALLNRFAPSNKGAPLATLLEHLRPPTTPTPKP